MSRLHSAAILALSLIVLTLSVAVVVLGTSRESLYVDPGHLETAAPLKSA